VDTAATNGRGNVHPGTPPSGTRPLRVTICGINYAPEATGIAPYTTGLAQGLVERGHDVRVLTTHPHYPEWRVRDGYGAWRSREEINGVRVRRLKHYVPTKPLGLRRLLSELSLGVRLLVSRWRRPDVLVLVSPALFSVAAAAARARWSGRLTTAVWVQDLYSVGMVETSQGGGPATWLVRAVESLTLRAATGVAVIHDRFRQFAVDRLGVPEDHVEVIRNWSHVEPARHVDRAEVRARLGWMPDETVVLHAGNMGIKQGLENVVEAARLADAVGAPVRFVLLGDGNQRERLQSLAAGVRSVRFLAPLSDEEFQRALVSADVLLVNELAGMREMAVPSKLTSYFAASLPVLAATDEGSVTAGEIEASGGGVRVPAGDPRALLDAALALRANPAQARALGAAGRRYRDAVLTERAALDHFEEWLMTLVADRTTEVTTGWGPPAPQPRQRRPYDVPSSASEQTEAGTR
jgi:putative colanic acid biosynthesis glycosyltransferase WcaI